MYLPIYFVHMSIYLLVYRATFQPIYSTSQLPSKNLSCRPFECVRRTLNVYFPVGLGLHDGQPQGGYACARVDAGSASSADANTAVRSGLRIRTPAGGRVRSGQPQVRSGTWPGLRNGLPTAAAGHNGTGKGRVTQHRSHPPT